MKSLIQLILLELLIFPPALPQLIELNNTKANFLTPQVEDHKQDQIEYQHNIEELQRILATCHLGYNCYHGNCYGDHCKCDEGYIGDECYEKDTKVDGWVLGLALGLGVPFGLVLLFFVMKCSLDKKVTQQSQRTQIPQNSYNGFPKCSICLDEIYAIQEYKVDCPLKHIFHQACIKKWLFNNKHCPECQTEIKQFAS